MVDIISILKQLNGYWKYQPGQQYLAKLTSGKISDTFLNTGVLTSYPEYLYEIIGDYKFDFNNKRPNVICGPALGGITLAYEIAIAFGARMIFTEPTYRVDNTPVILNGVGEIIQKVEKHGQELSRFSITPDDRILFVEDVITTGKSTLEMINAVLGQSISHSTLSEFIPQVFCLINRSNLKEINVGSNIIFKIRSVAEVQSRTWNTLDEAKQALPGVVDALRPKANWERLTKG